jgi:hypothetical protein
MRYLIFLLITLLPSLSSAEQFLCIAEKASGFKHEGGEWIEKPFNTNEKYLVNFEKRTVNRFGESDAIHSNCTQYRDHGKKLFDCSEDFGFFIMSSETMKYMITLPWIDYVLDETGGTPHIELGTCTKF